MTENKIYNVMYTSRCSDHRRSDSSSTTICTTTSPQTAYNRAVEKWLSLYVEFAQGYGEKYKDAPYITEVTEMVTGSESAENIHQFFSDNAHQWWTLEYGGALSEEVTIDEVVMSHDTPMGDYDCRVFLDFVLDADLLSIALVNVGRKVETAMVKQMRTYVQETPYSDMLASTIEYLSAHVDFTPDARKEWDTCVAEKEEALERQEQLALENEEREIQNFHQQIAQFHAENKVLCRPESNIQSIHLSAIQQRARTTAGVADIEKKLEHFLSADKSFDRMVTELLLSLDNPDVLSLALEEDDCGYLRVGIQKSYLAHQIIETVLQNSTSEWLQKSWDNGLLGQILLQACEEKKYDDWPPEIQQKIQEEIRRCKHIGSGRFWMGLYDHKREWIEGTETPAHIVQISKDILVSVYPVTQVQYAQFQPTHTNHFSGNVLAPVENVSWFQALCYCNFLSRQQGLQPAYEIEDESYQAPSERGSQYSNTQWNKEANGWRLPTEAEWEYFARAQSDFDYPGTNDSNQIGPYNWLGYDNFTTIGVGQMLANPWGIHDLCGNVGQICWDYYYDFTYKERVQEGNVVDPVNRAKGHGVIGRGTCSAYVWGRGATSMGIHNVSKYRGFRIVRNP